MGIDLSELIDLSVGSVIYSMLAGESFNETSIHLFRELKFQSNEHMANIVHPFNLIQQKNYYLYKYLPGFKHYQKRALDGWIYLMEFFDDQIREHKEFIESLDDLDSYEATDLIYQFLKVNFVGSG
jgi:hypothetical protein